MHDTHLIMLFPLPYLFLPPTPPLSFYSVISHTQGQKLRRRTNADSPDGVEEVVISIDEGFSVTHPEGGAFFAAPTFGVEKEARIPVTTAAGTVISAAAAPVASSDAVSALWQGEEQDKRSAIEWDVDTSDTPRGFSWPRCHWHAKYAVRPPFPPSLPFLPLHRLRSLLLESGRPRL